MERPWLSNSDSSLRRERAGRPRRSRPSTSSCTSSVSLTCGHTASRSPAPDRLAGEDRAGRGEAERGHERDRVDRDHDVERGDACRRRGSPNTTLTNSWNAANSRNQLSPFGRPNREHAPELAQRQPERARGARGAPPHRRQNATARNAKPTQLADRARRARRRRRPSPARRGGRRSGPSCRNTVGDHRDDARDHRIQVLPRPPYQLPSASTPTIARDRRTCGSPCSRPSGRAPPASSR